MILVMVTTSKSQAKKIAEGDEYLTEIIKDLEEFESNRYLLESCDHDDEVFDGGFICGKEKGHAEGLEQGREEMTNTFICKLYEKGHTEYEISNTLDIPVDKIKTILNLN